MMLSAVCARARACVCELRDEAVGCALMVYLLLN